MKLSKTLYFAAPLAVLAIAGCGGGGGSDTTATTASTESTPALSKADLIARGDGICGEVNKAVGALGASAAEDQASRAADLYIGMVESINGLGAPSEPAGYAEFNEAAEELAKVEGEVKLASERGETTTSPELALEEFQNAAGEYGFQECSEGPSAPAPGSGASSGEEAESAEEGGVEAAPEEEAVEEPEVEEAAPEEAAPETGGAGGAGEEAAPEGSGGGSSGGIGPG
jgi:hypothetical protein